MRERAAERVAMAESMEWAWTRGTKDAKTREEGEEGKGKKGGKRKGWRETGGI